MGTASPDCAAATTSASPSPIWSRRTPSSSDVLGFDYVYSLPEMRHDDDWMLDHLNVDPRAVVREVRFYRCGFGLNFEVFEYEPAAGPAPAAAQQRPRRPPCRLLRGRHG